MYLLLYLSVYVFHSTCVYVRLLGEEYHVRYEELVTEMELHYFNSSDFISVTNPTIGKIYALKYDGQWHRVKVENVSGVEITVFFIDHGEKEVVMAEHLKELAEQFLQLAPQVFPISLTGLEHLADSPE